MNESVPMCRHIWMIDRRSLCDRRAMPGGDTPGWDEMPMCGPCLVALWAIRTAAAATMSGATRMWCGDLAGAIEELRPTRWGDYANLDVALEKWQGIDLPDVPYVGIDVELDDD